MQTSKTHYEGRYFTELLIVTHKYNKFATVNLIK